MTEPKQAKRVVYISSITSDIGLELARRYTGEGWIVSGTYRSDNYLTQLKEMGVEDLFYCDFNRPETILTSARDFRKTGLKWDVFVSLASDPSPLSSFFEGNFDQWSRSVHINAIEQLRQLHEMYSTRNTRKTVDAVFFAGPGTNSAPANFSALTVSKIILIKMCELLHADTPDINAFIVGPGWTRTKTHAKVLADPAVSEEKRKETERFLAQEDTGTPMTEIYNSIIWLCGQGREIAGGRNFSIVHDTLGEEELVNLLRNDPWMYKLRRHGNFDNIKKGKK